MYNNAVFTRGETYSMCRVSILQCWNLS